MRGYIFAGLAAAGLLAAAANAQQTITVTTDEFPITLSPNMPDVRSIGMGKTGVAENSQLVDMMFNPAALAVSRTSFEILGVQASLPSSTFDAISFLSSSSTIHQYKTGDFYKQIFRGAKSIVSSLQNGTAVDPAALSDINAGLKFTSEMQNKILGPPGQPKVHGVAVLPGIRGQIGHVGFALTGTLRTGFASLETDPLSRLYTLQLPQDFSALTPDQQLAQAANLLVALSPLLDPVTLDLNYLGAIPQTFAIAYLDIAASVGYGMEIFPDFQAGALLKVVNRRMSTKIIDPDHYDGILQEVQKDFSNSVTGFSLDLGGAYTLRSTGTRFGLSLQNIVPLPSVTSMAELALVVYDQNNNPIKVFGRIPFALKTPFVANIGASQPILHGLNVSFDWVDMFSNDNSYDSYAQRFRLGAEYRLETSPNGLAIAGRAGYAEKKFALGAGLDFWRVFRLDGAYGYDALIGDNSYFASFVFGF